MVMDTLRGITGPCRHIVRRQLLVAVEPAGLTARDMAA
jgi:hypothetical protein